MSSNHRRHFADPHMLLETPYNNTPTHICDICRSKLAGLIGYRCNACDFGVHEACADYFKETISFFAHPWHTLTLSRMPVDCVGWTCDLCTEGCPPGSLVYRCIQCGFEVHPLCTMLPQTIRSPLHPEHDLHMVPSNGSCKACHEVLPMWHYRCGFCLFNLHIACVSGTPSGGAQSNSSSGQSSTTIGAQNNSISGQSSTTTGAAQSISAAGQITSSGESIVVRPSRSNRVAKFLLKTCFHLAIDVATGGLASPVLQVLALAMN
ncbi:protein VACUOLELESS GAMETOPHYTES-like [Phragmites australis]|uniref:protein VACUOLELESS GAMETOPHYTES-like n=1 Tax=Phragmites australis TaxID=29695 RepID=UPI002D764E31|nr:protein VACUOLELESS GAMETOPHYTES-like [Phragmites australis]